MPAITRIAGWKYKEGTTEEQKLAIKDGLLKLYADVAHLVNHGPTLGENNSKMGYDKGFGLGFTSEFKSAEARDEFDPHPLHLAFVGGLQQVVEDVFLYDFVKPE